MLIAEARKLSDAKFNAGELDATMLRKVHALCDALEQANAKHAQYARELSQLTRESVEREKTLARLEAEVLAMRDAMCWIPVTEQLPTERGYYLTVVKRTAPDELGGNDTRVKIMRWLGEDWRYPVHIPEWINDEITETVTHWMPLPAAPGLMTRPEAEAALAGKGAER
jgi:hypothetical protein